MNIATYNVLAPIFAVKWNEAPGLNQKGLLATPEERKNSLNSMEWKNYSNWEERSVIVAENIKRADIVCVQEVTRETLQTLVELTEYGLAAPVFHTTRDPIQEYGNAIFYHPRKVELIEEHTVTHRDGDYNREAACASFRVGENIVKVASVHLTGFWPEQPDLQKKLESKQKGYEELKTYTQLLDQNLNDVDCLVIAGDFNESIEEISCPRYRPNLLKEAGYEFDGSEEFTEPAKSRKIDWIAVKFLKGNQELTSMGLEKIQKQASDHLMTGTTIASSTDFDADV